MVAAAAWGRCEGYFMRIVGRMQRLRLAVGAERNPDLTSIDVRKLSGFCEHAHFLGLQQRQLQHALRLGQQELDAAATQLRGVIAAARTAWRVAEACEGGGDGSGSDGVGADADPDSAASMALSAARLRLRLSPAESQNWLESHVAAASHLSDVLQQQRLLDSATAKAMGGDTQAAAAQAQALDACARRAARHAEATAVACSRGAAVAAAAGGVVDEMEMLRLPVQLLRLASSASDLAAAA